MRAVLLVMLGILLAPAVLAQSQEPAKEDCGGLDDHNQTVQCLKKQQQALTHAVKGVAEALLEKLRLAEQTLPKRYRNKLVKRFKTADKAWDKYRTTQCDYERMHALGGIDEPIVELQCKNELARQRLVILEQQLKMWTYE
jgi:uncharacterized protein YecT (DUF1311 family)